MAKTRALFLTIALSFTSLHTNVVYSLTSQADCTYSDLSDQVGPIRNQGDVGWCYANTAADLLTAYFHTKDLGVMSTWQLAIINNLYEGHLLTHQGGNIDTTLRTALRMPIPNERSDSLIKFGYCPISLEDIALNSDSNTSLSSKIAKLQKLKIDYDRGRYDPISSRNFWNNYQQYKSQGSVLTKIPESFFLNALEKSNPGNFLLRFADLICGEYRYYNSNPNLTVISHYKKGAQYLHAANGRPSCEKPFEIDLLPDLNRELDRKNLVGIEFYSSLIEHNGNINDQTNGHAASVVGRRWVNNSCQFLIRNSWGKSCTALDENRNKVSKYSKYVQQCVNGNLWIKETDLHHALSSLTYIQLGSDQYPQKSPPKLSCP